MRHPFHAWHRLIAPRRQPAVIALAAALLLLTPLAGNEAYANRRPDAGRASKDGEASKPQGPLLLTVSIARQRVTVYDRNGRIAAAPISSGQRGYATPKGIFSILQKSRMHYSNLYAGAPMPFMQRLTWSGVALHAGHLPGYPASHGCIRLPHGFARNLFSMTKLGARVIVTDDPEAPAPIHHEALLKPLPPGDPDSEAVTQASAAPVDADGRPATTTGQRVTSLLGVTAVAAAGAAPHGDVGRTRASVAAARAAELQALATAIEEANHRRVETADRLAEAGRWMEAAKANMSAATADRDRQLATAKNADKAREAAERELGEFIRKIERKSARSRDGELSDEEMGKAEATEDSLEERILTATYDAATARAAAQRMEPAIAELTAAADAASQRHDEIRHELVSAVAAVRVAEAALKDAKRAEARRDLPITVVVSRKTGKVHVRQGYDDVLTAPVIISEGEHPLGTHFFLAMSYTDDESDLVWKALTVKRIETRQRSASRSSRRAKRKDAAADDTLIAAGPAQTLENALARISIEPEVRDRLAELVKPGSTFVVTDEGIGNETGKYTDLIVLTR